MQYDLVRSGTTIRQLRIQNGYTQENLAKMLNIDRSFFREALIKAGKGEVSSQKRRKCQGKERIEGEKSLEFVHQPAQRAQKPYAGRSEPPALASIYRFALAKSTCNRLRFFLNPRYTVFRKPKRFFTIR